MKVRLVALLGVLFASMFKPAPAAASLYASWVGFVWAGQTSGSFVPHSSYSYNNKNGSMLVTWTSPGQARVDFGGFGGLPFGGNVQVTAYGSSGARCKVASWGLWGSTLEVYVACHAANGTPSNTSFVAVFGENHDPDGAWLWANNPTASHTPDAHYSYNAKGSNFVTRNGVGDYTVTNNGLTVGGGNIQVTAYGAGSEYCKVSWWSNTQAGVRCFNNAGQAADSRFTFRRVTSGGYFGFEAHYAWTHDASSSSYTPSIWYQEYQSCTSSGCVNSTDNTAGRSSLGSYWVNYPNATTFPSTALVTAYGADAKYCNTQSWGAGYTNVRCWNPGGTAADTQFSSLFLERR